MEPKSSLNLGIQPHLNSHSCFGYGETIKSEHITSQCYNNTGRRKSKVRLNDQLIPKPTDINMFEKMIKIAVPKEHPYSSHISKFAMFPSFCPPDDPETGVRAASKIPYIPYSAPDVTLLSKTIGGPYRHEVLETPMKTRKKAVMWTGEHGFLDHTKPLKGDKQIFYSTPPKTPPKLLDSSLSERTSNMLKNLERTHWITTYQMHHTGSGPANPLKIDDFKEKISDITGMNLHTAPLRERSFLVFAPSKPRQGCRSKQGSTYSPAAAELPNLSPVSDKGTASASINQRRPLEITAKRNEAPDLNQKAKSKYSSGSREAQNADLSQEVLHKQQTGSRERENCRVQFDESPVQVSTSQSSQEANAACRITGTEQSLDLYNRPLPREEMEVSREKSLIALKENFKAGKNVCSISQSPVAKGLESIESHTELSSMAAAEQEKLPHSMSNPRILPRPPILPGIRPVDRDGTVGRGDAGHSLRDLQNSFSKTKAHHNFNSSIKYAAVNLRDNVVTGRKHDFYGINCYYLHG